METGATSGKWSALPANWCRHDTMWVLAIYGCSVGGGTLFWPISLGLSGFWPMIILSILAFPVTFVPYMALCRFILAGSAHGDNDGNILDATNEHLGTGWGKAVTVLYFLTVYPGMAIYAITVTNTIIDFTAVQLHLGHLSRWIVAPLSVLGLMLLVNLGTEKVVKTMGIIVFPFIISIILIGIMAIPHWNSSMLATATNFHGIGGLMSSTWKGLPLVIFAFSITSITSSFVVGQKRYYREHAAVNVSRTLRIALLLVITTVLFFSWSCIFALSPVELAEAKISNLTILSFLARKFESPYMAIASQAIVFTAVIKAFLAHYLATEESAKNFGRMVLRLPDHALRGKTFSRLIATTVFLITTAFAIANPSVLSIATVAIVPVSVFVVYFLPLFAFRRVPSLRKYSGRPVNYLIAAIGIICLVDGLFTIFEKFK